MDEELFHRLAEEVEHDYQMGGLSGGLYEDYAHDILARYLAAQQSVQSDGEVCTVCKDNVIPVWFCKTCGTQSRRRQRNSILQMSFSMIDPIKFEYEGIAVIVDVCCASWKYKFDYLGVHHWGRHLYSWQAIEAAKNAIRKIKLLEAKQVA